MKTIDEIKTLLDEGKTEEVLSATNEILFSPVTIALLPESVNELYGLRAWAYYRRKEFDKAEEEAKEAGNNERALRCLAAIAAYVKKDGVLMRQYVDQLPDSPARDNTFVIYAREPADTTTKEEILARVNKWLVFNLSNGEDLFSKIMDKTNTANLLNNTARWFLVKDKDNKDLNIAGGTMFLAIMLYGRGSKNLHHRAGGWYWLSVIDEKRGEEESALMCCEKSIRLWRRQVKLDPTNPNFQKSLEGAKTRLTELKEKESAKRRISVEPKVKKVMKKIRVGQTKKKIIEEAMRDNEEYFNYLATEYGQVYANRKKEQYRKKLEEDLKDLPPKGAEVEVESVQLDLD